MAVIRITDKLLFDLLKEKLLLRNPIEALAPAGDYCFTIQTEIKGFKAEQEAVPIYRRSPDGSVHLVEFRAVIGRPGGISRKNGCQI